MPAKNSSTEQFARVSTDGRDATPGGQIPKLDNEGTPLLADEYGRLWINVVPDPNIPSGYSSIDTFNSTLMTNVVQLLAIGAGSVDLLQITGFKSNTAGLAYLQFHNKVTAPVAGNIPKISLALSGANISFSWTRPIDTKKTAPPGMFGFGIWAAMSSTPAIYTAVAAPTFWLNTTWGVY